MRAQLEKDLLRNSSTLQVEWSSYDHPIIHNAKNCPAKKTYNLFDHKFVYDKFHQDLRSTYTKGYESSRENCRSDT